MKAHRINSHSNSRAFISMQAAIIISAIVAGTGILAYEWRGAHPTKTHHTASTKQHHHKKHEAKPASPEVANQG